MRAQKRLLIALAALAAAGLAGCLNSPDSASLSAPVTEAEIQSAISAARSGDSLKPVRPVVCDTLKARLAALDSTAPQFGGLSQAVSRVCRVRPVHPDSLRPDSLRPDSLRPPKPPRPDTTRPDSVRPAKPDTLRPQPPVRDTVRPDTVRPVTPPAKPDSGMVPPRTPVKPVPPNRPDSVPAQPSKPPRPDSTGK